MAYSMPESTFKLMVMFFGLTNSLATFQAIMKNLLRDMIETRDVVVFIDNVIVRTEIDEEHDDIVEEILRKMTENDLFIKQEKCTW